MNMVRDKKYRMYVESLKVKYRLKRLASIFDRFYVFNINLRGYLLTDVIWYEQFGTRHHFHYKNHSSSIYHYAKNKYGLKSKHKSISKYDYDSKFKNRAYDKKNFKIYLNGIGLKHLSAEFTKIKLQDS